MPQPVTITDELIEKLTDEKTEKRLGEQLSRCELDPAILPADAGNLLGLVEALLQQTKQFSNGAVRKVERVPPPRRNCKPTYDMLIHMEAGGKAKRIGLVFICTQDKKSTWHYLRRVLDDPAIRPDHAIIVTDERKPLCVGEAGEKCMAELRADARYRFLELPFREVAGLHSLQKVVNDARSGDVTIQLPTGDLRTVSEAELLAALERLGRFQANPLVRALSTDASNAGEHGEEEEIEIRPFADGDL